jgi:hypothetical protein
MATLRWLLVIPSAISTWYIVLHAGLVANSLLLELCPPELMVSGVCTAPWYLPATDSLIYLCVVLLACSMVLVPSFVAPRHKLIVAAIAYVSGFAFALHLTDRDTLLHLLVAVGSGAFAVWLVARASPVRAVAA